MAQFLGLVSPKGGGWIVRGVLKTTCVFCLPLSQSNLVDALTLLDLAGPGIPAEQFPDSGKLHSYSHAGLWQLAGFLFGCPQMGSVSKQSCLLSRAPKNPRNDIPAKQEKKERTTTCVCFVPLETESAFGNSKVTPLGRRPFHLKRAGGVPPGQGLLRRHLEGLRPAPEEIRRDKDFLHEAESIRQTARGFQKAVRVVCVCVARSD